MSAEVRPLVTVRTAQLHSALSHRCTRLEPLPASLDFISIRHLFISYFVYMCVCAECAPCPRVSVQKCVCGREKAERPCASPRWNCQQVQRSQDQHAAAAAHTHTHSPISRRASLSRCAALRWRVGITPVKWPVMMARVLLVPAPSAGPARAGKPVSAPLPLFQLVLYSSLIYIHATVISSFNLTSKDPEFRVRKRNGQTLTSNCNVPPGHPVVTDFNHLGAGCCCGSRSFSLMVYTFVSEMVWLHRG